MAKKKKQRDKQTSKGIGKNVDSKITNSIRRDRTKLEKVLDKQRAWKAMKNPWLTVPNGNSNETAKQFIRVRANDLWGDPRRQYRMSNTND